MHGDLSPQTALILAKGHLSNARGATNPELIKIFYGEAQGALSRMGQSTLETIFNSDRGLNPYLSDETRSIAPELTELLNSLKRDTE